MTRNDWAARARSPRRMRAITVALWTVSVLLWLAARTVWAAAPVDDRVDPDVIAALAKDWRPDVIVRFAGEADLAPAFGMARRERGRFVYETLKQRADRAQAAARQQLEQRHGRHRGEGGYTVLWIDNSLALSAIDDAVLATLLAAPQVEAIVEQEIIPLPTMPEAGASSAPRTPGANIAHIKAPEVWALGYDGAGVVVGNIDTGVRHTHQAVVRQYRGRIADGVFDHVYNWYDPYHHSAAPRTSHPHGSHTIGTAVGDDGAGNQIGVAPGATWIACIGFGNGSGSGATNAGLLECGQWMLAPTDPAGNDPNPDLRADVVNNSWGDCSRSHNAWYDGVIDAWIAAGMVPVFSNGNASNCGYPAPPGLNTVGNPARSGKVLSVGSTGNHDGQYATHSNWGTTDNPNPGPPAYPDPRGFADLKPNVVAPGVAVRSAGNGADDQYYESPGTSMSAPHVAGLVALMWQAAPCLHGDHAATGTIVMATANPVPYVTGSPSDGPGNVPNQATGWGEIDALAAVEGALEHCGPQGFVAGTVTGADSGEPLAGAALAFAGPGSYLIATGGDGSYSRMLRAGDYSVDVQAFGYLPATRSVTIVEGETASLDVALEPGPRHAVGGIVVDSVTGTPLYARIHVAQPGGSTQAWTDPASGAYSIDLPAGSDYTLTASALVPGYVAESAAVSQLDADTALDFALAADAIACTAPGYLGGGNVIEDFENGELPAGWTRQTDRPNGQGWRIGEALGSTHFTIPAHGTYAASNDDAHGPASVARRERLITPALSFPPDGAPGLQYASAFSGGFDQLAMVEVSTDGGTNWSTLATPTAAGAAGAPQWRDEQVDLADYAGQTIRIAFRTDDAGVWGSGWAIDDVLIRSGLPCEPPQAGGFVTGRVLHGEDAPDGLNGAIVAVAGGAGTVTATGDDPAFGAGFYLLHVPANSASVTVSLAPYDDIVRTVTVPPLGARRIDFDFADPLAGDRVFRDGFEKTGGG